MFNFKRLSIYHQSWLFGGFFCVILVILVVFFIMSNSDRRYQEHMLDILASTYSDVYHTSGISGLEKNVSHEFTNTFCLVLTPDGDELFSNNTEKQSPAQAYIKFKKLVESGLHYELVLSNNNVDSDTEFRYLAQKLTDGNLLVVGHDIEKFKLENDNHWIIWLILSAIAIAVVSSIFIGYLVNNG